MPPIITHRAPVAHPELVAPLDLDAPPDLDGAARSRADRLAQATTEQLQTALSYLSAIDPEVFEVAFTAVCPDDAEDLEDPDDEEPMPVCRECGATVGIFVERGLDWAHYRGDGITAGAQEVYDPGHRPQVTWLLPGESAAEL